MNVTEVPVQIVVAVAVIETAGTSVELTVIVTPGLVAVVGDAQVAVEVNTALNTSPVIADVVEYVEFEAPEIAVPFFCHI